MIPGNRGLGRCNGQVLEMDFIEVAGIPHLAGQ